MHNLPLVLKMQVIRMTRDYFFKKLVPRITFIILCAFCVVSIFYHSGFVFVCCVGIDVIDRSSWHQEQSPTKLQMERLPE